MSIDDLDVAATAARYLASSAWSIHALIAEGVAEDAIKRLISELNHNFPEKRDAIRKVGIDLKRTRNSHVRFGDLVATTAHEIAIKIVYLLNQQWVRKHDGIVIEIVGQQVQVWPNTQEVIAEIELENMKAKDSLALTTNPAKRTGRPRKGESDKERLVVGALVKHHKWQPGGSIGNDTPAGTKQLADLASSNHVKVSVATVSRFFKRKFPNRGHKGYEAACATTAVRGIGTLLILWQGDAAEYLADLLPHESGREDEKY